ncbi:DUF952 domain-containing protein [bacterium]|nr:MAG: DUF952 domain-containing protein [bacterium]
MMNENTVYHITTQNEWEHYQEMGYLAPESLKSEGFIHCSTQEQLAGTISRFFSDSNQVVLLELDQESLGNSLIFEDSYGHGFFPHVYRDIQLNEIKSVTISSVKHD